MLLKVLMANKTPTQPDPQLPRLMLSLHRARAAPGASLGRDQDPWMRVCTEQGRLPVAACALSS